MADNTRSQGMRRLEESMHRNSEHTDQHAEVLNGIKSSIKGLTQLITTLNTKYDGLSEKVTSTSNSVSHVPPLLPNPHVNQGGIRSFQPKLDFPKFFGEDLDSWIYKCEKFFELNVVEETQKLRLAALHLEDKAMNWFRWYKKSHTMRTWQDFSRVVLLRFGSNAYEDAIGQLTKLRQWHTIRTYQEKFEELANKTTGLSEEFFVSCFVSGLKDEILAGVKMFQPRTIAQAMGLARLQEETIEAMTKKNKTIPKFVHNSIPTKSYEVNPRPRISVRKLTQKEIEDKRSKGLCFGCDEKYYRRHVCKKKQIFMLEAEEEEEVFEEAHQGLAPKAPQEEF